MIILLCLGIVFRLRNKLDAKDTDVFSSVVNSPNFCENRNLKVKQYSGYLSIEENLKSFFYWFFESRHEPLEAPTVFWFSGGPGASSMLALLAENGPCKVLPNAKKFQYNPYSWTESANMVWVDQPSGTGFSHGTESSDEIKSETDVALDMYLFIQSFRNKFPEYANSIYLVGESFGGHYVTAIAHKIVQMNTHIKFELENSTYIPLMGIAIGNGMTNTLEQIKWYPQMALRSSIVNQSVYEHMESMVPKISEAVRACEQSNDADQCTDAFELYSDTMMNPLIQTGVNLYDLRLKKPYDFSAIDDFLNDPSTMKELDAQKSWVAVNTTVWQQLAPIDFLHSFESLIPSLLDKKIKVLIYAGDQDYMCNWLGIRAWTSKLEWEGQDAFNIAPTQQWDGGTAKFYKNFAFVTVANSGHMVPMDQPENSLKLFNALLSHGDFKLNQFK